MRIGVYSGSFNPVHLGHIALSEYMVQKGWVEEVWLIRSLLNPLKSAEDMMSNDERLRMLELAIEGHEGLKVCTIEDSLPVPNYTITTLRKLKKLYPEHDFHLIIGADNWQIFDRWREWESILNDFRLIVYPRPGFPIEPTNVPHVSFVEAPLYNISSTQIRNRLANGESLKGLVCEKVENFLLEKKKLL